eukprot:2905394-Amphidinium_carterae.1
MKVGNGSGRKKQTGILTSALMSVIHGNKYSPTRNYYMNLSFAHHCAQDERALRMLLTPSQGELASKRRQR